VTAPANTFFRFAAIGGIGFLIEAVLLWVLYSRYGVDPFSARAASFSVAVASTWYLNRNFTFHTHGSKLPHAEFVRYLGTSGFGLAANILVYTFLIIYVNVTVIAPWIALIPASATGLAFNYLGCKYFSFRGYNQN